MVLSFCLEVNTGSKNSQVTNHIYYSQFFRNQESNLFPSNMWTRTWLLDAHAAIKCQNVAKLATLLGDLLKFTPWDGFIGTTNSSYSIIGPLSTTLSVYKLHKMKSHCTAIWEKSLYNGVTQNDVTYLGSRSQFQVLEFIFILHWKK